MKNSTRFGSLAVAVTAAAGLAVGPTAGAAFATPASPSHQERPAATPSRHAVFVQTDDVNGNHVAAYAQGRDGRLTLTHTYATGGKGGILPTSVIDHTASQGAVTYDRAHQLLYVVNAGSNTVSVFGVDGDRLQLRQVLPSGGVFPVSVAVHHDVVYVANAQEGGSVQGYRVFGRVVVPIRAWNRPLGLDPTLTAFTQTPGQVAFSPDGSQLLVTTKANTDSIDVFALGRFGGPVGSVVHNVRAGSVPFALDFAARRDRAGHRCRPRRGHVAPAPRRRHPDAALHRGDRTARHLLGDPQWEPPVHDQPRWALGQHPHAARRRGPDRHRDHDHGRRHRRPGDQPGRQVPLRRDRCCRDPRRVRGPRRRLADRRSAR